VAAETAALHLPPPIPDPPLPPPVAHQTDRRGMRQEDLLAASVSCRARVDLSCFSCLCFREFPVQAPAPFTPTHACLACCGPEKQVDFEPVERRRRIDLRQRKGCLPSLPWAPGLPLKLAAAHQQHRHGTKTAKGREQARKRISSEESGKRRVRNEHRLLTDAGDEQN
jgi:hypothetical protein